ncbi:hypothetical protein Rleg10DRAFT_5037 [Rhizobium leguminosarum bv. trifolii WSM2012]|nr:hypothetical protein Rleg10DRAFT_3936 [Rhizobium leguminosarum bv. trifolii WSM2012]EJC76386.1 hypothetical protein Rleg10DRAFT_5037 [Rhizobium leguminosarum bv. trifolii WSM2012]
MPPKMRAFDNTTGFTSRTPCFALKNVTKKTNVTANATLDQPKAKPQHEDRREHDARYCVQRHEGKPLANVDAAASNAMAQVGGKGEVRCAGPVDSRIVRDSEEACFLP